MLIISGKHLRKRYIYPNNTINIYSGSTCIWPYIIDTITGAWLISLSASTNTVANTGGTIILTHSVQRTITSVWVHYEGTSPELHKDYKTETAVASLSTTIGTINGNILTIPNNPDSTTRNIVVTANYAGVSKQITITLAGGYNEDIQYPLHKGYELKFNPASYKKANILSELRDYESTLDFEFEVVAYETFENEDGSTYNEDLTVDVSTIKSDDVMNTLYGWTDNQGSVNKTTATNGDTVIMTVPTPSSTGTYISTIKMAHDLHSAYSELLWRVD